MNLDQITTIITPYLLRTFFTLLILLIGWQVIKVVNKVFAKFFDRSKLEPSLKGFLLNLSDFGLKGMLVLIAVGTLGVEMTSLVALLGGAGVAIGMALSGTLQNFAGGLVILAFKPFKVGDYIEAQALGGTVREIQIFNTILTTPDNKTVVIPNAQLSNQALVNFTTQDTRRVDLTFSISYQDDISIAKNLLQELVSSDSRVIKDLNNQIIVGQLSESAVNIHVRTWVLNGDYWDFYFDLVEKVKTSFDKNGITIPVAQRLVSIANPIPK